MSITFGTVVQIQEKVHFWIALIKTFPMIYNLFGFEEAIVFGNDGNEVSTLWDVWIKFTEGGGTQPPPPSALSGPKSPVLLWLSQ